MASPSYPNPVLKGTDSSGDAEALLTNDAGAIYVADQSVRAGEDSTLDVQRVIDGYLYKQMTASGIMKSGSGYLAGFIAVSAGADDIDLTLHDNTAASGAVLHVSLNIAASANSVMVTFPKPIKFNTGVYATIAGTTPVFNLIYI